MAEQKLSICPNKKCEHVETCSLSKPHTYSKPTCNGCDIGELHCPACVPYSPPRDER